MPQRGHVKTLIALYARSAAGDGGGVLVAESGAVTLAGELDGNGAAGHGGCACAVGAASLTILDGTALRGNTAAVHGGGLFVGGAWAVLGADLGPHLPPI
jgi:hypothetical protein